MAVPSLEEGLELTKDEGTKGDEGLTRWSKGLVMPGRSSVFRRMRGTALGWQTAAEKLVAPAFLLYGTGHALLKTNIALWNGDCN